MNIKTLIRVYATHLKVWTYLGREEDRGSLSLCLWKKDENTFATSMGPSTTYSCLDMFTTILLLIGYERKIQIDLGVCPKCRGKKEWSQWVNARIKKHWEPDECWSPPWGKEESDPFAHLFCYRRPCPLCGPKFPVLYLDFKEGQENKDSRWPKVQGTGRKIRSWTDLIICGEIPEYKNALTVYADQLIEDNDPLGKWLSAWLVGKCQSLGCHEGTSSILGNLKGCTDCHGHGLVIGAFEDELRSYLESRKDGICLNAILAAKPLDYKTW